MDFLFCTMKASCRYGWVRNAESNTLQEGTIKQSNEIEGVPLRKPTSTFKGIGRGWVPETGNGA
ncbi:hypothetical protein NDI37_11445 [Funiculus sociatus GB2-A5]|uniref:Uncharacterized protein n=1 Tax=Funiculus sociatus GB2-A5 TaxID=2933946 RepID=A0ABV0JNV0_9CYAN|nr:MULTISPECIES: hypothetical protein [unclassified Trichocoleus]MBD1908560.1 hypothetical protein [Trichocoleus sp. FACHB-832]MBD1932445.1 hypothetical protein [Trichocoleus sp. FACHB-69]MBD2063892.1 hypothetical protein [Trichocoleus sp. FACHB-6]